MQNTQYFETNSDGEQVLSIEDDAIVHVQDIGASLSFSIISGGGEESDAYTYDTTEGFYRFSPADTPQLVDELDGLLRVLSREFDIEEPTRNPEDGYELVVEQESIPSASTSGSATPTTAEFELSPSEHSDALLAIESILERVTSRE